MCTSPMAVVIVIRSRYGRSMRTRYLGARLPRPISSTRPRSYSVRSERVPILPISACASRVPCGSTFIYTTRGRWCRIRSCRPSAGFEVVDRTPAGMTAVPLPNAYAPTHGVVVPTHTAEALIAYLASLKQPPFSGIEVATNGEPAMADMTGSTTASSATASARVSPPAGGYDAAKGAALFTANCSACHQANGEGLPGAFPSLKNNAVVNKDDAAKHIQVVLQGLHDAKVDGVVYGSAMPPFAGMLSDAEIADIIDYERSSWGNHGKPIDAAQVAAERTKAK
jgi:mono/diheme cytochrome c family protein